MKGGWGGIFLLKGYVSFRFHFGVKLIQKDIENVVRKKNEDKWLIGKEAAELDRGNRQVRKDDRWDKGKWDQMP